MARCAPDRGATSSRYTKVRGVAQGVVISSVRCFAAFVCVLALATVAWLAAAPVASTPSNAVRRAPRWCCPAAAPRASRTSACSGCSTAWASGPISIVGTSMGAVVGALYASGYTGRELDSLARVVPLAALFRTYQPLAPRSLGILQPLVLWEQGDARLRAAERLGRRGRGQRAGQRRHAPRQPARAGRLRLAAHPVPRRRHRSRAPRGGRACGRATWRRPCGPAPRCRCSSRPSGATGGSSPTAGSRPTSRWPWRAREGADRVIVVDATEHPRDSLDVYSPLLVADRLVQFLFQQTADSLRPGDLLIRPDVNGFTSLNFSRGTSSACSIAGVGAADIGRCRRLELPRPGADPTSARAFPPGWSASRIERRQRLRAARAHPAARARSRATRDTLDFDLLLRRVRTLATASEAYESVWLTPTGRGRFGRARSRRCAAPPGASPGSGLAYDNELGGRMWAGVVDRRLFGRALEGSGALFLGELRRELLARRPAELSGRPPAASIRRVTVRLANEDVRRFDADGREIGQAVTREAVGFAGHRAAAGAGLGPGARRRRAAPGTSPDRSRPLDRSAAVARADRPPPASAGGCCGPRRSGPGCTSASRSRAPLTARLGVVRLRPAASARLGRWTAAPARLSARRGRRISGLSPRRAPG